MRAYLRHEVWGDAPPKPHDKDAAAVHQICSLITDCLHSERDWRRPHDPALATSLINGLLAPKPV